MRQNRGDVLPGRERRGAGVRQQVLLAKDDGPHVFHRAGRKIGHADDVQLAEGIPDAEVRVVERELLRGGLRGEACQLLLVRRGTDPERNAVPDAVTADEVADQQRDEIRRHLERRRERNRVLAGLGAGGIRDLRPVRDGSIARVDHEGDVERGLERRFVDARKRAARVRRLHLGHGVLATVGLAQIEPAQLVVQHAGERDLDCGRSHRKRLHDRQRRGLRRRIERRAGLLRPTAAGHAGALELELRRVQCDGARRPRDRHPEGLAPPKGVGGEIGREPERVMLRDPNRIQALCSRGGDEEEQEKKSGECVPHATRVAAIGGVAPVHRDEAPPGRGLQRYLPVAARMS